VQPAIPVTPVILHVPTPLGVIAPIGPVTVAEKIMGEPKAADVALLVRVIVGSPGSTFVTKPEVPGIEE